MNKHCFRTIFSKTLQRIVVVSELAKLAGKSESESMTSGAILQKNLQNSTACVQLVLCVGIRYLIRQRYGGNFDYSSR